MTTSVDIANRALAAIAARSTIGSIELEQSVEAKQVRLLYAPTRDALLRAAHWDFAKRTAYLSLLKSAPGTPENPTSAATWDPTTMPAPPWFYEYAYPSDCVLMRYVTAAPSLTGDFNPFPVSMPGSPFTGAGAAPFRRTVGYDGGGNPIGVVLTNARGAVGGYTARIEVEDLWDPSFQEAMVAALASRLALAMTGNVELSRTQAQIAFQQLKIAQTSNANEGGPTTTSYTPDWIRARGYFDEYSIGGYYAPWVMPSFLGV